MSDFEDKNGNKEILESTIKTVIVPPKGNKSVLIGGIIAVILLVVGIFYFFSQQSAPLPTPSKPMNTDPTASLPKYAGNAVDIKIDKSPYSGLGEDYRKGSDDAKVVIVEFSDLQCPACSYNAEVINKIAYEFGNRILVVFKNYPLDNACNSKMAGPMHPEACSLAMLARCAGEMGNFWQFHDLVFGRSREISKDKLKPWAMEVGIKPDQYESCLKNPSYLDKIKEDINVGDAVGVNATPMLFINGRKYLGPRSFEALQEEISSFLNK